MDNRSLSVSSEIDGETETTELAYITNRSDKETLMRKEDLSDQLRARQTDPSLLSSWLFDTFSFCAAFTVFIGVVAILAIYDGRPNPLWTGGITLNTVISVASMLFRICLMVPVASCISQMSWIWLAKDRRLLYDVVRFDQASHSPYVSFQLLFSHHVQYVISARVDKGIYSEIAHETDLGTESTVTDGWVDYTYPYIDKTNGSVTNTTLTVPETFFLLSATQTPFRDASGLDIQDN
jgi:hypothetical protein